MNEAKRHIGLKTTPVGKQFVGFCSLRKKELRSKTNGELYLAIELGDWSGRLSAKIWEEVNHYNQILRVGEVIKVKGVVQTYQNRKELQTVQIRNVTPEDKVNPELLLPASKKNIPELQQSFYTHLHGINNKFLKQLITGIFDARNFEEKFFLIPAGKLWHHNYLSGMLEHVLAMLDLSDVLQRHYPNLKLDLLKTGIILHDAGKIEEYAVHKFIDFTDKGRLIGHVTMGYEYVSKKIDEIEGFPEELRIQLLHLIVSHQADFEKGSPVKPMTLEAIILHYLNEIDSKANAFSRIIMKDKQPDSNWTKYVNLLDRFLYAGERGNQESDEDN
jgi:3'-5' exoribonuclease